MIMITRSESTTLNLVLTWVPDGTPVYSVATTESLRAAGYTPAAEVADVVLQRDEAQREVARLTARIEATDAMLAAEQESPTRGEDSRACSRCGGSGSRNGCRCTQCFGTGRATNKNSSGPAGSSAEEEPNPTPSACSEGLATPDNPSGRPVGNVAKPECEPEGTPPHAPAGPGEASQTSDGPAMLAEKPSAWLARYSTTHPCCTIVDAIGAWLNHAFPRGAASRSDGQEDFPQCQAEYPGVRGGSWACVLGHGHAGEHRDTRGLWAEPKGEPVMTRANNVGMGDARVNGGVLDEAESAARHYAARGMLVAQPVEQAAQSGQRGEAAEAQCAKFCSCAVCMPWWPRHSADVAREALARVSELEPEIVRLGSALGHEKEHRQMLADDLVALIDNKPVQLHLASVVRQKFLAAQRAVNEERDRAVERSELDQRSFAKCSDELDLVRTSLAAVEKERDELLGQAHFDELARADAEERATALVSQLSARDAELAACREELRVETLACTQLHCDVSNAWIRFRDSSEGDANNELWDKLAAISSSNPHAIPPVEPAPEVVREIRVGSTWEHVTPRDSRVIATVLRCDKGLVRYEVPTGTAYTSEPLFRDLYRWVSDPPQEPPPPSGDK